MIIYHGSEKIIENPQFGFGNNRNDYGLGFYCTQNIELAKEWACQKNTNGYANEYELDISTLSVLNLSKNEYNILNWLCLLMQNRIFTPKTPIGKQNLDLLLKDFKIDCKKYDVILGYRANDSYFSFASDFLENIIPIQNLASAMKLGELGMQVVLKTEKAFSNLVYKRFHKAESEVYFQKYKARDSIARKSYFESFRHIKQNEAIYIIDIFRNPELLNEIKL